MMCSSKGSNDFELIENITERYKNQIGELTMDNYGLQIISVCRQTWYNLYGVFPKAKDMIDMLGREYTELIESVYGQELRIA